MTSTPYEHGLDISGLSLVELKHLLRKRMEEASIHRNRTLSLARQIERIQEEIANRGSR